MAARSALQDVLASWLPQGRALSGRDFAWRHRVVCTLVALHVPVLLVLAMLQHGWRGALETAPVPVLLAVALGPLSRRAASMSATLALVSCSALIVHLFDGRTEAHFHYFVAVAVVALYQDWASYAVAVGFVAVQHAVFGLVARGGVYSAQGDPLLLTAVHTAFVLGESAVLVLFWHANEQARASEEVLQRALWEGQASVQERLRETDRIRSDLIATVSHEFRTPLTGIRGAALTLLKRGDRLDSAGRERLLQAVLDQQERLSRLLENMLTASQATAPDPSAAADVHAVATEVAMLADSERPGSPPVSVLVEPGAYARIDRQALHQVLANLVDNAVVHGRPGAVPLITGGTDQNGVWVTVSNDGSTMNRDETERLFRPFERADSGSTRGTEGLGMGLYVVRKLVEVYGGRVDVDSDAGWVTVQVRLSRAGTVAAGSVALAS